MDNERLRSRIYNAKSPSITSGGIRLDFTDIYTNMSLRRPDKTPRLGFPVRLEKADLNLFLHYDLDLSCAGGNRVLW